MATDWVTALIGFGGAAVGAGTALVSARVVLKHQLRDARRAREDAERIRVTTALAASLTQLAEVVTELPADPWAGNREQTEREQLREERTAWKARWRSRLMEVQLGALEIKEEEVRTRLLAAVNYISSLHMLQYAFHGRDEQYVLRGVIADMTQVLFAWKRGEGSSPPPNWALIAAKESFERKQEEYEITAAAEEEDRQRRRLRS